jgi:hypothetical protein
MIGLIGQDGGQVAAMAVIATEDVVTVVMAWAEAEEAEEAEEAVWVAEAVAWVEEAVAVDVNYYPYNRMNPTGRFFLLYITICLTISIIFYFIFKRSEVLPILPYAFETEHPSSHVYPLPTPLRRNMNKGIPGMDTERGKPLPAPMPVAPNPLIVHTKN